MSSSKTAPKKKVAESTALPAKKIVKKAVETAKTPPPVKEVATKKAAPLKVEKATDEKTVVKKIQQSDIPDIDTVVSVTIDGTTSRALVTAVHGGLRIDAVVQPVGADNYAIGSVPYADDTDLEPYWNF